MIRINIQTLFTALVLIITFISVNIWSPIPLGNIMTTTLIQAVMILCLLLSCPKLCLNDKSGSMSIFLYIGWVAICSFRGMFVAANIQEYKQLIVATIGLLVPMLSWLGYRPDVMGFIWKSWFKYALIAFACFFFWIVGYTQFYLSPLLLLFCFFPLYKKKEAWFIFIAALLYIILAGEGRSQMYKSLPALAIGFYLYMSFRYTKKTSIRHSYFAISKALLRMMHLGAYLCSIVVFLLILKNVIAMYAHKVDATDIQMEYRENSSDTRSLIYIDVIDSAIRNDYVWTGRTPARGNDVIYSGLLFDWAYDEDDSSYNKDERHINEVGHINVFTWCGIIGLLLISFIYFRATFLAVHRSHNVYISLLGCYVAFMWSYSWIENVTQFDILNVSLWTMVGMCMSARFRNMNNIEFQRWIRSLLIIEKVRK